MFLWLAFATWIISWGLNHLHLASVTKEYPLPDRIVGVPAPKPLLDSIEAQAGTRGLVVYAKEPIPFNSPADKGSYYLYGYVGTSQPLSAPVAIYIRAKDPSEDPTCKVFATPSVIQDEVANSYVYVCGEGENDLRVALVEFAGTSLSSFCSSKNTTQERRWVDATFLRDKFWIGIRWTPLFPHPLTVSFSNVMAYGPSTSNTPSLCATTPPSR